MAVRKKPVKKEKDVEELIGKGGSVATPVKEKERTLSVQLRVEKDLLDRIDSLVANRQIKTPRHRWFLEAIHEKVEREEQG